jgi:hypothetical protein
MNLLIKLRYFLGLLFVLGVLTVLSLWTTVQPVIAAVAWSG